MSEENGINNSSTVAVLLNVGGVTPDPEHGLDIDLDLNTTSEVNDDVTIWVENCTSPLDNIDFQDPKVIGSLVPLGMVCIMVIFGNMMVIGKFLLRVGRRNESLGAKT